MKPSTKNKIALVFFLALLVPGVLFVKNKNSTSSKWAGFLPESDQAKELFSPLHENIYKAFSKSTGSEIYDQLSKTIEEPFLSRVYDEIYRYSVHKVNGGPEVEVEKIRLREFEKVNPGKGILNSNSHRPEFQVICSWDVLSKVTHFGHWHLRTNHYKAIYTLGLFDGQWKITEDQILWQQRIKLDLSSFKS